MTEEKKAVHEELVEFSEFVLAEATKRGLKVSVQVLHVGEQMLVHNTSMTGFQVTGALECARQITENGAMNYHRIDLIVQALEKQPELARRLVAALTKEAESE